MLNMNDKYKDLPTTAAAIEASGAEMVTVAVRRVNLSDRNAPMLQDYVSPERYTYLPNTAGCFTADEAVRLQGQRGQVTVSEPVRSYLVDLVRSTRRDERVALGVSPRGALSRCDCSSATTPSTTPPSSDPTALSKC